MAGGDEADGVRRVFIEGLKPGDVALLRDLAETAAEHAVKRMLTAMGLDPEEPLKAQRDFNFLRDLVHDDDLKDDMGYLRRQRKRAEGATGRIINVAVGLAVVGALHAIWTYLRLALPSLPPIP